MSDLRTQLSERSRKRLDALSCPDCGSSGLTLEKRLMAKNVGEFSLAGNQLKFSANEYCAVVCGCGWSEYAELTPPSERVES